MQWIQTPNEISLGYWTLKQGETKRASLEHLIFYPQSTDTKYATVVALHGRGTDEFDLLPLVETLALKHTLVIAPRAPLQFDAGGLVGGFAWYEFGEEGKPRLQTFEPSVDHLRRFLEEIRAVYPVDPGRLFLLGFSQGAVMAYATALQDPGSVRGIAALSGYVPLQSGFPLRLEHLAGLAVFISHGTYDEVIPVRYGRESAELLKSAGANVVFREYPMQHEVSAETLRDLCMWFKENSPELE
jgi:phospholipase/carboxylesterase